MINPLKVGNDGLGVFMTCVPSAQVFQRRTKSESPIFAAERRQDRARKMVWMTRRHSLAWLTSFACELLLLEYKRYLS